MSIKLRDLIRNVRACKTAAEERAVIAKESALIRTSFKEEDATFRHRNVAKLIFMHMLGYPTHFGQMECLKLIASPRFLDKRVGYLGLALLVEEAAEVLTLVTNSLSIDLTHKSPYVQGLALAALGNISNTDMLRDLSGAVLKLLQNPNVYVRKKALLCAVQVFQKVEDMVEDFLPVVISMLADRNHAVLLTATSALLEIARKHPAFLKKARKAVPQLVKNLKTLVLSGYAPEYDVNGITDPFLQVTTLRLLGVLGAGSSSATESMSDILAQVATNTESSRNTGNAILYECVRTIFAIDCEDGLRVLAVNILGRFLQNRDNNIRYVALAMLSTVVNIDRDAVQRHQSTIVDCLRDSDLSIRVRAVDLVFSIMTPANVELLSKEALSYLVVAPDSVRTDLCTRLAEAALKLAPSKQWHVHLLISMMSIAGRAAPDDVWETAVALIGQPESEAHRAGFVHRLFQALKEDASQTALVCVAVWTIGEFGHLLRSSERRFEQDGSYEPVPESEILDLLDNVRRRHDATVTTKAMTLTAMAKLAVHLRSQHGRAAELLGAYERSMNLELQSRSCELRELLTGGPVDEAWLAQMPVPTDDEMAQRRVTADKLSDDGADGSRVKQKSGESGDDDDADEDDDDNDASDEDTPKQKSKPAAKPVVSKAGNGAAAASTNLLDLDDIFGGGSSASAAPAPQAAKAPAAPVDLLAGIFGSGAPSSPAPAPVPIAAAAKPRAAPASDDLLGVFGGSSAATVAQASAAPQLPAVNAYSNNGITVVMYCANGAGVNEAAITATYSNSNGEPVHNFLFQVAVPKYLTLRMDKPSGSSLGPFGQQPVQQRINITNAERGSKPIIMKVKITYTLAGKEFVDQATVQGFPAGL